MPKKGWKKGGEGSSVNPETEMKDRARDNVKLRRYERGEERRVRERAVKRMGIEVDGEMQALLDAITEGIAVRGIGDRVDSDMLILEAMKIAVGGGSSARERISALELIGKIKGLIMSGNVKNVNNLIGSVKTSITRISKANMSEEGIREYRARKAVVNPEAYKEGLSEVPTVTVRVDDDGNSIDE